MRVTLSAKSGLLSHSPGDILLPNISAAISSPHGFLKQADMNHADSITPHPANKLKVFH